ncbi:MAG: hypothetical protein AABX16_00090 [Nanoarchaeota archaeon]
MTIIKFPLVLREKLVLDRDLSTKEKNNELNFLMPTILQEKMQTAIGKDMIMMNGRKQ